MKNLEEIVREAVFNSIDNGHDPWTQGTQYLAEDLCNEIDELADTDVQEVYEILLKILDGF